MGIVSLSSPPKFFFRLRRPRYEDYKPWLLENFFFQLCSYCLLRHDSLQVEHYEPQKHSPHRENDPTNLLLGCGTCNGAGGKSDYHPAHVNRRRCKNETHGFLVLDVRTDDLSALYTVDQRTGALTLKPGAQSTRAAWNIILLNLDIEKFKKRRIELLQFLQRAEGLLTALKTENIAAEVRVAIQQTLDTLSSFLRNQMLFFSVFEIPISNELQQYIQKASRM